MAIGLLAGLASSYETISRDDCMACLSVGYPHCTNKEFTKFECCSASHPTLRSRCIQKYYYCSDKITAEQGEFTCPAKYGPLNMYFTSHSDFEEFRTFNFEVASSMVEIIDKKKRWINGKNVVEIQQKDLALHIDAYMIPNLGTNSKTYNETDRKAIKVSDLSNNYIEAPGNWTIILYISNPSSTKARSVTITTWLEKFETLADYYEFYADFYP